MLNSGKASKNNRDNVSWTLYWLWLNVDGAIIAEKQPNMQTLRTVIRNPYTDACMDLFSWNYVSVAYSFDA